VHVAPECSGSWPLGAKAVPFPIATNAVTQIAHMVLDPCPSSPSPCKPNGMLEAQGIYLGGPAEDGMGPTAVKTWFLL
jgi:hypothetical protein